MIEALDIWVKGIVQGVGFRPFVYRLARTHLITGWVLNASDGVHIHAEGEEKHLDEFVLALSEDAPPAAQVTEIEMHEVSLEGFDSFEIRFSEQGEGENTLVSPDLAICKDCERELFDPTDRRYRYPFINCTNCGPRFTITHQLPYDRANTSMATFPLCEPCSAEYSAPENRRFHAQPNACFDCGPELFWQATPGAAATGATPGAPGASGAPTQRIHGEEALAAAVRVIAAGGIAAVKGLGGYHLVCLASCEEAVSELRVRKGRDGKAFAVMMQNVEDARQVCTISASEERLLESAQRPIVLLRKRAYGAASTSESSSAAGLPLIAPSVAPLLPELGVMLPYTPVQHLILHDLAQALGHSVALVMTSGNLHDEPIVTSDEEAITQLGVIADGVLGNNREIVARFDDSVARVLSFDAIQFVRRARGYAPAPLALSAAVLPDASSAPSTPTIFATGPEQKNTFTFLRGNQAFVSQHIGDLENAETFDAWQAAKHRYQTLFDLTPQVLACDAHPEYLSTKWAQNTTENKDLPLFQVQHQFAHIVAALAENGIDGPTCGIAFDGTGYGADGNIWGGEVLLCNVSAYERFANFSYVPMPGGAQAIKHPLRMAYGVLWAFDLLDHEAAQQALQHVSAEEQELYAQMIEQGINTPNTSSCGRLFDAASALLGICTAPTYEGEAAVLLEAAAWRAAESFPDAMNTDPRYTVNVTKNVAHAGDTAQTTSVVLLDAAPVFAALLDDMAASVCPDVIAQRFHQAMAGAIVTSAQLVAAAYDITSVTLSGGVFLNRFLTEHVVPALAEEGFTVVLNQELPPNDGCVSLGQAIVAAHAV